MPVLFFPWLFGSVPGVFQSVSQSVSQPVTCKKPTNPRHWASFHLSLASKCAMAQKGKRKRKGGCGGIDSSKFLSHLPFSFLQPKLGTECRPPAALGLELEPYCHCNARRHQPSPSLSLSLSVRHVFVPDPKQARAMNGSSASSGERVQGNAEADIGDLSKMIVERTGRPCLCHPRGIRLPQVGTEC
ncbi:hypothetical protein LI328DRAFT_158802 [Trichoderma asperelloides]|nr:hypothetical protein LI328DRAFT_158802 [Trichoderma asperelloides]